MTRKNVSESSENASNNAAAVVGTSSIPWMERRLYWVIWSCAVGYAIHRVYLAGRDHIQELSESDFVPGWPWLGTLKDVSDYEWDTWSPVLWNLIPWLVVHSVLAQLLRCFRPNALPFFYVAASVVYLSRLIGLLPLAYMILQTLVMFAAGRLGSKRVIWSVNLLFLFMVNFSPLDGVQSFFLGTDPTLMYIMSVGVAWTYSRCLSFGIDRCNNPSSCQPWPRDLLLLLSYILYLPFLLLGPLIPFEHFERDLNHQYKPLSLPHAFWISLNVLRYLFWFLVNELVLQYIYFNALQFEPQLVTRLGLWEVCGLGYCLGQFFMMKYVIFFGFPALFARVEQYSPPQHPKCIGRIHLYSDMWKYFDRGLYTFLLRYIYKPYMSIGFTSTLPASFLCFSFVFLWHGVQDYVLIWAALNFLGVTIEGTAMKVAEGRTYRTLEAKLFSSPRWAHRWRMLLVSPLLMLSALSNFYFFAGRETGDVFVYKICWEAFPLGTLIILMFLYCTCHVGSEMAEWDKKQEGQNISKHKA